MLMHAHSFREVTDYHCEQPSTTRCAVVGGSRNGYCNFMSRAEAVRRSAAEAPPRASLAWDVLG